MMEQKNQITLDQELEVQELVVSGADYELFSSVAGTPIINSDQYLGVAGNYGALASTALTNSTGSTTINGNLGESPGTAVSGTFVVTGSTDIANAAASSAQTAATNAFSALQTLGLAGTTIAAELGGQTLNSPTAGVTVAWQSSTSFGLSLTSGHSTLTLNGPGKYVIYSPSTLLTGASGSTDFPVIALTGGALAKNVYFVVGSSATINQSTSSIGAIFQGNIVAHTSITLPQIATVNGSLLANTGAITFSNPATVSVVSQQTSSSSINLSILVREPIDKVFLASDKIDSSNTVYDLDQAHISIVDSKGDLTGRNQAGQPVSDRNTILLSQIPGSSFAVNDCVIVRYRALPHL